MLKQFLKRVWDGGNDPSDSELYEAVAIELSDGLMDLGLWTKSCALSDGDTERARAAYIQMRVNQLRVARNEMAGAFTSQQQVLEQEARRSREDVTQEAAMQASVEASNAPIYAAVAALDEQRRPLLAELYGAKTDSQRKRAAAKLLPLDTRRADLLRKLRS